MRRLPTCVGCQPSGVAFQLNLRLSSASDPTAPSNRSAACAVDQSSGLPSDRSPACAFDRPSGPAFRTTCGLRRLPILRPCPPMNLQLAPSIHLPARPSSQLPACAFGRPSGPAFEPNLRLSSVVASPAPPCANQRLAPPVNPWLCLRASFRPSPGANLPALPSRWPPACAECQPSSSALEATSDSRQLLRSRRCRPFNL